MCVRGDVEAGEQLWVSLDIPGEEGNPDSDDCPRVEHEGRHAGAECRHPLRWIVVQKLRGGFLVVLIRKIRVIACQGNRAAIDDTG